MSLILDALNKAQREREEQREPVPHLTTVHSAPPPAPEPRKSAGRQWLVAGVAALCVLAFAGGLWLAGSASSPGVVLTPQPVADAVDRPAARAASSAAVKPAVTEPDAPVSAPREPVVATGHDVAGLYRAARDKGAERGNSNGQAVNAGRSVPEAPAAEREADAHQAQRPAAVKDSVEPAESSGSVAEASVQESKSPSLSPAVAATLAAREELPSLQELSWSTQQQLPSIMYSEHHYAGEVAQQRVVINGTSLRPGAQVGQGLVLEEILQDGVVLRYQSQKFKLEALNSWVNF